MKKLILMILWLPVNLSLLSFSLLSLVYYHPSGSQSKHQDFVYAQELIPATPIPVVLPTADISPRTDIRVTVLHKFLTNYDSPLAPISAFLVDTADRWGLDYAIIPAISMQESGGCKVIPYDSYNCWGFGIYGTTITRFASYEEAITKVAKTIKESYIKDGLVNPTLLENRWAPQSEGQWSYAVNYFTGKIRDLEKSIPAS